jgi:hypothetical protein
MPKPRFNFRDINKERLKKISLSSSSLPPVSLFPEEKSKIPAITDGLYNYYSSQDNINDDVYNFYGDENDKLPQMRHQSLENFDDLFPIENKFLFDPLDDEDDDENSGPPQMTTTTTIASFKCQTQTHTQQTTVTIYQTHTRASSL